MIAEVLDIQTWTLIWRGPAEDLLLHKSGTVSVPRFIMYEGEMARNGWIGLDGKQVLVLMWP